MPRNLTKNLKSSISRVLLAWYKRNARTLPWRKTRNPYRILVSEIMLQQTQVSRVLLKYPEFLHRFPNFDALSKASAGTVIRSWAGMGYNNRAIRLQRLAQKLMTDFGGHLPSDISLLLQLPGIGCYTAHAVACFAFEQQTAVVDTNVRRVLTRLFPDRWNDSKEWEIALTLLPKKKAYDWNQALMELGALVCVSSQPRCSLCPLQKFCPSAYMVKTAPRGTRLSKATVPDRIYRGKIISVLRTLKQGKSLEMTNVGGMIRPGCSRVWLRRIISGLERDGLITIRRHNQKLFLSLPR